jgi:hypothetical protein
LLCNGMPSLCVFGRKWHQLVPEFVLTQVLLNYFFLFWFCVPMGVRYVIQEYAELLSWNNL